MQHHVIGKSVVMSLTFGTLLTMTAAGAAAFAGDYSLITGEILIWPEEQYGSRMAVIRSADDQLSFVRITPATTSAIGLRAGTDVSIVAREGNSAREFTALSMHPRMHPRQESGAPSERWQIVTGRVGALSGSMLILDAALGRWAVDLSHLGSPSPPLTAGETVTVIGRLEDHGRLGARGLARDTTAPSALPR